MKHTREECEGTLRVYLRAARGIKLGEIDATIKEAREHGDIAPENVRYAESARERCLQLIEQAYGKGSDSLEFELAMEAGQTLFEIAKGLRVDIKRHPLHAAHCSRVEGGRKGAEKRKEERAGTPLRDKVLKAIRAYKGKDHRAMATIIAKRLGCSPAYVRKIRNETDPT